VAELVAISHWLLSLYYSHYRVPEGFFKPTRCFESIDFITDFFALRRQGMVDISESRGYSFFKDKEITICHENSSYLEELMVDSIKNMTKV